MLTKAQYDRSVWSGIIRDAVKNTKHHERALAKFDEINAECDALSEAVLLMRENE